MEPTSDLFPSVTYLMYDDPGNAPSRANANAIRVVTVKELIPLKYMLIVSMIIHAHVSWNDVHMLMISLTPSKLL